MMGFLSRLFGPGVPAVTAREAHERVRQGALLLDVRERDERARAAVPGARAIALGELPQRWQSLPKEREIVVLCASGARSARAAAFLSRQGMRAANIRGGLRAWQRAGLPTT